MLADQVQQATTTQGDGERCASCQAPRAGRRCEHCGAAFEAGGWVVDAVLSATPHGRVYRAHRGGQVVALKELHFALVPGPAEVEAFEREARVLSTLHHPAIPRFVEAFQEGAGVGLRFYLATELIEGPSLLQRLEREGPLTPAAATELARALLHVLVDLQARSPALFHRDVKPANVLFRADGRVALVDFGAVRQVEGSATHRSTLVGTFGYMPPEQLGGSVDRTSDVYALAATVLHALTGRAPADLVGPTLGLQVPPSVPPVLAGWLRRALAPHPAERFPDAQAALDALEHPVVVEVPATRAGEVTVRTVLAAVLALALVVAGGVLLWSAEKPAPPAPAPPAAPPITRPVSPPRAPVITTTGGLRVATSSSPTRDLLNASTGWFGQAKPKCNTLQVGEAMRTPPPPGPEGAADGAACYALAGRYPDARALLDALSPEDRLTAAARLEKLTLPVAQLDDVAAYPMMELVVSYRPESPEALYHAGVGAYARGDSARAQRYLLERRRLVPNDPFHEQVDLILSRIAQGLPANGEALHMYH